MNVRIFTKSAFSFVFGNDSIVLLSFIHDSSYTSLLLVKSNSHFSEILISFLQKKQNTVSREHQDVELLARGRHDPCVVPRGNGSTINFLPFYCRLWSL